MLPHVRRTAAAATAAAVACTLALIPTGAVAATSEPTDTTPSAEETAGSVDITLLGINDFHGRINDDTVNFAGTIEELRAEATGPTLFLSVGDNIGASLFASAVAKDQPTLDILNALELQASAVGNHEFDRGFADLTGRVTEASDFPYLGANVYLKGTTEPALDEYVLLPAGDLTIGVIGAVTEETGALVSPEGIADISFGDPVAAVNRVAAQLSDGDDDNGEADILVALYHEGAGAGTPEGATLEQEVAAGGAFAAIVTDTAASVDAIFTGHTHKEYVWSAAIPDTDRTRPIVQTGSYGDNVGKITLTADPATGEVSAHTEELVPRTTTDAAELVAAFPRVAEVDEIVTDALANAAEIGNTRVAEVSGDITTAFEGGAFEDGVWTGGTRDDRASESALGNLVAESIRSSLSALPDGAQIGVTNPGGLRAELWDTQAEFGPTQVAGLADGEISFSHANAVLPFNNTMALVTLTGAQFTTLLEQQWQRTEDGEVPSRPYLQLGLSDNVTYTFDDTLPEGERITSVTVDGAPLDESASYRIGTVSFLASGGDNFRVFTEGTGFVDTGLLDYEAWIDYLADGSPVTPSYAKHAVAVTGAPDAAEAGTEVSFEVSGLNMTSRGAPETTVLTATLGETELGSFDVVDGAATVTVTIPATQAAGTAALTLSAAPTGTLVTVPLTVTPGEEPAPWATVDVGDGSVAQGGSLAVTVSGLEAGRQISATLHSDPIVVSGIPAAGEDGIVRFSVAVPEDFETGAHTLVVSSEGVEPISTAVTVTAKDTGDDTGTGDGSDAGDDTATGGDTAAGGNPDRVAETGGTFPVALVTTLALAVVAAGMVLVIRRRLTV